MPSHDERYASTFKETLNKRLSHPGVDDVYSYVQVLLLHWEVTTEKDDAFREESERLGDFLANDFKYNVKEFPIPLVNSNLSLQRRITDEVYLASEAALSGSAKALLIIHYGGHGDDCDRQGRSIWASSGTSSPNAPLVEWYRIQDSLYDSTADILLLLDCCFSGSAGRARGPPGRIEILTASAKWEETPTPGPKSFTNGLIEALKTAVSTKGVAIISDIHRQLLHRSAGLPATSVDVVIRPGTPNRSIRLHPLQVTDGVQLVTPIQHGPSIRLLVQTPDLDIRRIEEIAGWLRTDIPNNVSLQVESIVRETKCVQSLVEKCGNEEPLGRVLDTESTQDIAASWKRLSHLIYDYATQHRDLASGPGQTLSLVEKEAREFLRVLDAHNKSLVRYVERGILQSTYVEPYNDDLDSIIKMPQIDGLGISDQLRLRQAIIHPEKSHMRAAKLKTDLAPGISPSRAVTKWTETKVYGPYQDPADIPLIEKRVSLLAELLAASKSSDFRSLRCCGFYHDNLRKQFVLEFDIPPEFLYQSGSFSSVSLNQIIVDKKWNRPTLGQRFGFAAAIARAVGQWHSVGWLHQTINSHNILFFQPEENNPSTIDYSQPFLQGLDFARPNLAPSMGRPVDHPAVNVYRHPDRQGPSREGHNKLHDLYSLGVVLLEIGLWESACTTGKVKVGLEVEKMSRNLKTAADTRVAHYAGREFQEAVTTCLNSDFGVDVDDKTNSNLAKAFEAKVVDKLGILEVIH